MQTLYRGGLVFDGTGSLRANHGVLVEGEWIVQVAPLGAFAGFAGPVVDTSGGTLLPGLIDCHVHLCFAGEANPADGLEALSPAAAAIRALSHAQAALAGGITGLRDCGGKAYIEFAVRDACNAGAFLGPTIRAAGRVICMTGGHGHRMGRVADGAAEVTKAVREQIHAGCDFVKLMASGGVMTPGVDPQDSHYTPDELAAGVREARRFRRPTASHAQGAESILWATQAGIDSIEHGFYLDDRCVEEMVQRGTFLVPTLSAVRGIAAHADRGIPAYVVEKVLRIMEAHAASVRRFYEAGGRIAMGTDAGTPFNLHGANAGELAHMVDIGMTPRDALMAATAGAADLAGLDDRGRIEPGRRADLLIIDGDPLERIDNVADRLNHRLVVKNGLVVRAQHAPTAAIAAQ